MLSPLHSSASMRWLSIHFSCASVSIWFYSVAVCMSRLGPTVSLSRLIDTLFWYHVNAHYYTIPYYTIPWCYSLLQCTVLPHHTIYHTILYYYKIPSFPTPGTIPHYTTLHQFTTPHHRTPYYHTILNLATPYYTIPHRSVPYHGVVWFGEWCGTIPYHIQLYHTLP